MLTQLPTVETPRNLRRERRLWHDGARHTPSMGCARCPDHDICGGLQVGDALFDCLGFCCHNAEDCDVVCRNKPEEFARRVREVGGFSFENVPRAPRLAAPPLPALVPLLYHKSGRSKPFQPQAVCLPLYSVIRRQNGETRYTSTRDLADGFGIAADVPVILSGTAKDRPLERWWSLGAQRICKEDLNEVIAAFVQDKTALERGGLLVFLVKLRIFVLDDLPHANLRRPGEPFNGQAAGTTLYTDRVILHNFFAIFLNSAIRFLS